MNLSRLHRDMKKFVRKLSSKTWNSVEINYLASKLLFVKGIGEVTETEILDGNNTNSILNSEF